MQKLRNIERNTYFKNMNIFVMQLKLSYQSDDEL